jgi:hypothetical protein
MRLVTYKLANVPQTFKRSLANVHLTFLTGEVKPYKFRFIPCDHTNC